MFRSKTSNPKLVFFMKNLLLICFVLFCTLATYGNNARPKISPSKTTYKGYENKEKKYVELFQRYFYIYPSNN